MPLVTNSSSVLFSVLSTALYVSDPNNKTYYKPITHIGPEAPSRSNKNGVQVHVLSMNIFFIKCIQCSLDLSSLYALSVCRHGFFFFA